MAKKKGAGGGGGKVDKNVMKKKEKNVEDKTFGMKNKNKSKKVQKFVQQLKNQGMDKATMAYQKQKEDMKKAKEMQAAHERELANMFRTVQQKPQKGMDPKSVICAYFKQGLCKRGDKCKFSHNYVQARKVAKLDMYTDPRYVDKPDERANKTDIICKFFLEACEKRQYGALWICENDGNNCPYNHCLPEGFVLERDKKMVAKANEEQEISIEEQIEIDRKELLKRDNLTPVTKESFEKWQAGQVEKRRKEVEAKVKNAGAKGTNLRLGGNILSGRELFTYDPSLFVDDADAADDIEIQSDPDDDDDNDEEEQKQAPAVDIKDVKDASLFLDDDEELPSDNEEAE